MRQASRLAAKILPSGAVNRTPSMLFSKSDRYRASLSRSSPPPAFVRQPRPEGHRWSLPAPLFAPARACPGHSPSCLSYAPSAAVKGHKNTKTLRVYQLPQGLVRDMLSNETSSDAPTSILAIHFPHGQVTYPAGWRLVLFDCYVVVPSCKKIALGHPPNRMGNLPYQRHFIRKHDQEQTKSHTFDTLRCALRENGQGLSGPQGGRSCLFTSRHQSRSASEDTPESPPGDPPAGRSC